MGLDLAILAATVVTVSTAVAFATDVVAADWIPESALRLHQAAFATDVVASDWIPENAMRLYQAAIVRVAMRVSTVFDPLLLALGDRPCLSCLGNRH